MAGQGCECVGGGGGEGAGRIYKSDMRVRVRMWIIEIRLVSLPLSLPHSYGV